MLGLISLGNFARSGHNSAIGTFGQGSFTQNRITKSKMSRKRLTKEIVNERLTDRSIVMLDEYVHQKVKARFQCSQGHTWKAVPNNVLFGKGCPTCGRISSANKKRLTVNVIRNRLAGQKSFDARTIGVPISLRLTL
jgi:hypothetical protein